jgi:hypothetical protein
LPDLKLVSQPPLQLLLAFSSVASFPCIESGKAVDIRTLNDTGRVRFATCVGRCGGFATRSTEMTGSEGVESVVGCDTAGPHSKTVANTAAAEGATTLDDNLMTISSSSRDGHAAPMNAQPHLEPA